MGEHGFRASGSGRLVLRAGDAEKELLGILLDQLEAFVAPPERDPDADPLARLVGIDEEAQPPDDPALARLLPDAYREDPEAARDFRRFTERSLREDKVAHIHTARGTLLRSGSKVVLTVEEAQAWLGVLTDLRLTLGTRVGVTEDNHDELAALPEEDPRAAPFQVYDWLTYLQETLVQALLGG